MANRSDISGRSTDADRDAFFGRISAALGRLAAPLASAPPAGHPTIPDELVRQVSAADPALIERWVKRATGNSMVVQRTTVAGLLAGLDGCLANHQITSLLLNADPFTGSHRLGEHLAAKNIQAFQWTDPDCRAKAFNAHAAITTCRWAIADSGSLVVWSDARFGRSSTLTASVHIVLLGASQILPDMVDAFARLGTAAIDPASGTLPSNIVVINGPSKTSDIEMQLVTGVHGPKYLYVLLLDDQ